MKNNQIRIVGFFILGMLFVWGIGGVSAQTINAPTNLNVSLSGTFATLSWTDNSTNELNFRIERSSDGGTSWSQIAATSTNVATYIDKTPLCYSNYRYRVRAYSLQYSSYSNVVSITTGACTSLVPPNNATVDIYGDEFTLSWQDGNGNSSSNILERSSDGGTSWTEIATVLHPFYIDRGLICGTNYSYRVRAYRQFDDSYSDYSVTTIASYDCANPLAEEVCTFTPLTIPEEAPRNMRLSGNGQRAVIQLAVGLYPATRNIEIWDVASKTLIATIPESYSSDFAVDEDGSRVVFESNGDLSGDNPEGVSEVFLWDNGTLSQLTESSAITEGYQYYDFSISSDGTKLAFLIEVDDSVRIGYWEEGVGLIDIVPEADAVFNVALSGDGNKLAFVNYEQLLPEVPGAYGQIYFWDEVNGLSSIGYPDDYDYEHDYLVTSNLDLNETGDTLSFRRLPHSLGADVYRWNAEDGFVSLLYPHNLYVYGPGEYYYSNRASGISADGSRILLSSTYDLTGENPDFDDPNSYGEFYGEFFFVDNGQIRQITSTILLNQRTVTYGLSSDGSRILIYSNYPSQTNPVPTDAQVLIGDCSPVPPAKPDNLSLLSANATSINLSWADNADDETSYHLERSYDNGTSWTEIANLAANSTSFSDSATCGTILYRVRAENGNGYSAYSNVLTVDEFDCAPVIADPVCTLSPLLALNQVWDAGYFALSGDGSRAFVVDNNGGVGITIYQTSTGNLLDTIAGHAPSSFLLPSEDGQRFFFNSLDNGKNQISLWENGTLTQLTNNTDPYGFYVSASANQSATKLLYGVPDGMGADTDLYIWEEGLGTREIIPEASYISAARLSGDGNTVVFVSHENLTGEDPSELGMLYIWDEVNGIQGLASFSSLSSEAVTVIDYDLVVNADASRIAVIYYEGLSSFANLAVWTTGEGLVNIAPDDPVEFYVPELYAYSPIRWAGDGDRLLFASTDQNLTGYNADNSREYYFLDGGEIRQITSSISPWAEEGNTHAAMSSDGTKFLVTSYLPAPSANNLEPELVLALGTCDAPPVTSPTALEVDSSAETSITLNWTDNALDESQYRLERSDNGISWTEIAQVAANSTSYSDTGLSCNTSYDYRIRAYRAGDSSYSAYSNIVTGSTAACPPPAAPTGLTVTGTTETSVSLSWTDNASNETSYSLERSLDGTSWIEIQALATNSSSYTDNAVNCNTGYQYRVRAYRSGDTSYSSYSNVVTGTTITCPPPAAPTGLTVTGTTQTSVSLSWTDNAVDETSYSLERSADAGATWAEIAQPAANATSYSDTSATCNTSYDYRIRAYRSGDTSYSTYSNVVTGTTDICIVLNAPTNIQQTANSQTGMSLSWTDNSTNESGYEIERSLDGTNWTLLSSLPANSTSYSDSGLTCSTGYQYRLRSNHLGTATYSPYASSGVLSTASCPALIPSVLSSTGATQNSISLSWTVDSNGTSFTLAYYNGSAWVNLGIFPSTTTTYTHTGLSCNRSYQYQVTTFRVTDSASVSSSAFTTSTSACPPLANPNAPIVVNTEPALVSLQIPAMPATATSMSLERSSDGISWTNLGNVSTNYLDTAVVCGSSYQYRLVALRSSDGVTSASTNAVALTDACPIPTVLGVYRAGLWVFVDSNNTAIPTNSFNFGDSNWQALVGDWDGDGIDGVGIYRNGEFVLKNLASADSPENRFNFGNAEAGWQALVGDWNGDGIDSVGLYKDGLFILSDDNSNMNYRFNFGYLQAGWQVLAGDWDGNGADGIALYKEGFWMLVNDVNNPDASSFSISYGPNQAGWTAIVGDWNGDGMDSIGLYGNGIWRMRTNSVNDATETSLNFGQTGDIPLAIFESP